MDGFKNSTKTKYMCGGPVKKARGGMMDEGISTRPVDKYGRRMTNEELGMTPGGVDPAKKKPVAKSMNSVAEREGSLGQKSGRWRSGAQRQAYDPPQQGRSGLDAKGQVLITSKAVSVL